MEFALLKKFGLTTTESKIYLQIIRLNETTIGPLIKLTNLHRGTVYNSINNLIKKGFVGFIDKVGARYYQCLGEEIFKNIISEKERTLIEEKKVIQKFFEDIDKFQEKSEKQEVKVFYGTEAFKTLFLAIYEKCKKENTEYLFLGRGGEMQDEVGEGFYRYTQKLKKKLKLKCRAILDRQTTKHSYHKYVTGNLKYLPSKVHSPVNFWIYKDEVLLVLFGTMPLISIKVKNNSLADGFRNYFEILWKKAKKYN